MIELRRLSPRTPCGLGLVGKMTGVGLLVILSYSELVNDEGLLELGLGDRRGVGGGRSDDSFDARLAVGSKDDRNLLPTNARDLFVD